MSCAPTTKRREAPQLSLKRAPVLRYCWAKTLSLARTLWVVSTTSPVEPSIILALAKLLRRWCNREPAHNAAAVNLHGTGRSPSNKSETKQKSNRRTCSMKWRLLLAQSNRSCGGLGVGHSEPYRCGRRGETFPPRLMCLVEGGKRGR